MTILSYIISLSDFQWQPESNLDRHGVLCETSIMSREDVQNRCNFTEEEEVGFGYWTFIPSELKKEEWYLRRGFKMILARWRSQPMRKRLRERQPITVWLRSVSSKLYLSSSITEINCFRVVECPKGLPMMFIKFMHFDINTTSSIQITGIDQKSKPQLFSNQLFSNSTPPPIDAYLQLTHSSVIFEFSGDKNDFFDLYWECRRYFMRPYAKQPDNVMEFVVSAKYPDSYDNIDNLNVTDDLHCLNRGLQIGIDLSK